MTVLVIGAAGRVASQLTRQLVAKNVPVRVLVRNRLKLRTVLGDDLEARLSVVEGSFEERDVLDRAFDGANVVYQGLGTSPRQIAVEAALIDAAARASVSQMVRLSVFDSDSGGDYEVARRHGEIDAYLARSGLAHTRLCPTYFSSNLLPAAPSIATADRWMGAAPNARIAIIDVRDVGDAAAEVMVDPRLHNKTYLLTGPTAVTFADVADVLRVLGRRISYVPVDRDALRSGYAARGVPDWLTEIALGIDRAMEAGRHARVTGDLAPLIGKSPRTIDDFVRDHVGLFSGTA